MRRLPRVMGPWGQTVRGVGWAWGRVGLGLRGVQVQDAGIALGHGTLGPSRPPAGAG